MKIALLFAVVGAPWLQTAAPVELVSRPAVGDVFEEKESSWRSSSAAVDGADDARPSFAWSAAHARGRPDASTSESSRTLLDEVLAVKDDQRVKVERTFVAASSTRVDATGGDAMPRSTRAAFEGQTVVLVADGDGTRIVGELDGEEELAESDLALAPRWEQVLPGEPVDVGATWTLSDGVARSLLEGMDVVKATAWCELDGVDAREAGKPARIQLELRATTSADSGSCEIEASGTVLWNTAAGHLVEVALSGEIHATGPDGVEHTDRFGLLHETRKLE